jgi:hypothetical protein
MEPNPDYTRLVTTLWGGQANRVPLGDMMLLARTPADARPAENEQVTLDLNLNKLHLFDPQSEVSLLNHS